MNDELKKGPCSSLSTQHSALQFNILLKLAYDGTSFLGWQKTDTGPSVEGTLEAVLEQILQEKIQLQAASRTDAGVHALGQVVNFFTSKELDWSKLRHSLNQLLPRSVAVLEVMPMPAAFHPTLDCIQKRYRYTIDYAPVQLPQHRLYAWHCPYPLDIAQMQQAALLFEGTHDFQAFTNAKKNEPYTDFIRTVSQIAITELPCERMEIELLGNRFLYKMVRNIVGTLMYVGRGKMSYAELPAVFENRDRSQAGVTAPAHGLTLVEVLYDLK